MTRIAELRASRRNRLQRAVELARSTLRDQRSDVARIVSQWNRISKRINRSIEKYSRVVDELGLFPPDAIRPVELLDCIKACVDETQRSPLDAIDETLAEQQAELKKAAAASARRRKKRDTKRKRRK